MEPLDLESHPPADDPLETWLRRAPPPLPDDGFTPRVLAALPSRARAPRLSRRLLLCGAGGAAGVLVAWSGGASWPALVDGLAGWARGAAAALAALANPLFSVGLATALLSVWYARRRDAAAAPASHTNRPTGIRSA